MNTFRTISRVLVVMAGMFVVGAKADSFNVIKKDGHYVLLLAAKKALPENPAIQTGAATGIFYLNGKFVESAFNLDDIGTFSAAQKGEYVNMIGYSASNYAIRKAVSFGAEYGYDINYVASKCDVLPEKVNGYVVRNNVKEVVREVSPLAQEIIYHQLSLLAVQALMNICTKE